MRPALAALFIASAAALAAEDAAYTVPFNGLYVHGSLNGQEGHIFLPDTGSTLCIITPEAAARAGWDAARGRIGYAPSVAVGGAVVRNVRTRVDEHPGPMPLRELGINYSGILGHSFFEWFVTTFDYPRQQLTLVPVASAAPLSADGKRSWLVPFRTAARIMIVEGKVNGHGPFTFIVDSGANFTMLVPAAAKKLGIRGKRKTMGFQEAEIATVESISAGDAEARNLTLVIDDRRAFQPMRQLVDYHGVLGATYLRRFVVTFDYRSSQLRLASE